MANRKTKSLSLSFSLDSLSFLFFATCPLIIPLLSSSPANKLFLPPLTSIYFSFCLLFTFFFSILSLFINLHLSTPLLAFHSILFYKTNCFPFSFWTFNFSRFLLHSPASLWAFSFAHVLPPCAAYLLFISCGACSALATICCIPCKACTVTKGHCSAGSY